MSEAMPESITAMRTATYDVAQIVEDIAEEQDKRPEEVTLEEVMDRINDYAIEDLATSRQGIIFQDQYGGEVEL